MPRLLEKNEQWNLITKPGIIHDNGLIKPIYQILMRGGTEGTDMTCRIGQCHPGTFVLGLALMMEPYELKWTHVAIQVQFPTRKEFTCRGFVNGNFSGGGDGKNISPGEH